MSKLYKGMLIAMLPAMLLAGCKNAPTVASNNQTTQTASNAKVSDAKTDQLASLNYQSGQAAYVDVNNNKSTLNPSSFKYVHVDYSKLDHLNRTSSANTAYLDSRNVANDSLRVTQYVKPTGWHQKFVNNNAIINRGHMIAYSLSKGISVDGKYEPNAQSGDQNNPKNLFTQSAFSNQKVQTIYETKVRNALRNGKKVIYQVKPIFSGNDLMAKGVQLQAISTDKTLDFNVYLFNVQPGIKFDYATGRSTIDNAMNVPTPAGAPTFNDNNSTKNTNNHYEGERNGNMVYHQHHWVRDYLIYRGVKHFVKNHAENRGYERGYEEAKHGEEFSSPHHSFFSPHHSFFSHHSRW